MAKYQVRLGRHEWVDCVEGEEIDRYGIRNAYLTYRLADGSCGTVAAGHWRVKPAWARGARPKSVVERPTLAVELAAKVRGYFTNRAGEVQIGANLDGDRDLYDLASRITSEVISPGTKGKSHGEEILFWSCPKCGQTNSSKNLKPIAAKCSNCGSTVGFNRQGKPEL